MTNPYFTKTGNPAPNVKGRSSLIREEFALIEAGFDAITTQGTEDITRALRLPIGDDGDIPDLAADRAQKFLTFDGSGVPDVWPPQSAINRASKVVGFDVNGDRVLAAAGNGYSWLPSPTGKEFYDLSTDGTDPLWRARNLAGGLSTLTGPSSPTDSRVVTVSSFTTGDALTLPDARTLAKGTMMLVEGLVGYAVRTNDAALLYAFAGNTEQIFVLVDNSTQAGSWRWYTVTRTDYTGSTTDYVLPGPETEIIASMTTGAVCEISSGVYLLACGAASGGIRLKVVTAAAAPAFTFTTGSTVTAGSDACLTGSIAVRKLSTGYIVTYLTASGGDLKAIPVSVSGTTPTAGTIVTIKAAVIGAFYDLSLQTSGDKAVVIYQASNTTVEFACLSYSSNVVTVGAAVSPFTAGSNFSRVFGQGCLSGTDQGFFAITTYTSGTVTVNNLYAFTVSGTTLTVGTGVAYNTTAASAGAVGVAASDANTCMTAWADNSGNSLQVRRMTKSGTVVSAGTNVTAQTLSNGSSPRGWIRVHFLSATGVFVVMAEASAGPGCDHRTFYFNGTSPTLISGGALTGVETTPVELSASRYMVLDGASTALRVNRMDYSAGTTTKSTATAPATASVGVAVPTFPAGISLFSLGSDRYVHFEAPASMTIVEAKFQ